MEIQWKRRDEKKEKPQEWKVLHEFTFPLRIEYILELVMHYFLHFFTFRTFISGLWVLIFSTLQLYAWFNFRFVTSLKRKEMLYKILYLNFSLAYTFLFFIHILGWPSQIARQASCKEKIAMTRISTVLSFEILWDMSTVDWKRVCYQRSMNLFWRSLR